jgi:hypothetical protein
MYIFLLGQSQWKWPMPWQQCHLILEVRPVEVVDDNEGFAAAPCKTEDLLVFKGAVDMDDIREAEGAVVEGTCEVESVIEERAVEGGGALEDADLSVKELLGFGSWPCNSFSANIASWNKW